MLVARTRYRKYCAMGRMTRRSSSQPSISATMASTMVTYFAPHSVVLFLVVDLLDDGAGGCVRVAIVTQVRLARVASERDRPGLRLAMVDDSAVAQVAVELETGLAHRDGDEKVGYPLLHNAS